MAASVVHFGDDVCFRLPVLRSAGYTVAECDSLEMLTAALARNPDAVLLEAEPLAPMRDAAVLVRSSSRAALILFCNETGRPVPDEFDLVIPSLTAPEQWLDKIAALLQQSRTMRPQAQTHFQESEQPSKGPAPVTAILEGKRPAS